MILSEGEIVLWIVCKSDNARNVNRRRVVVTGRVAHTSCGIAATLILSHAEEGDLLGMRTSLSLLWFWRASYR